MGDHANRGFYSILSNLGLHQNRNLGHCHNKPNPGYNIVIDTNGLPIAATTNHSRKRGPHLYLDQRRHRLYQVSLPLPEVPQIRRVGAEKYINVNIHRCHRWNRNDNYQRKKHCSKK